MQSNFEVLLVESYSDNSYIVTGTSYANTPVPNTNTAHINASLVTISSVKELLPTGVKIIIPKVLDHPEVLPSDLIITDNQDKLQTLKNVGISTINNLMHQNILNVCVIDAMDYLNTYMKLLNAGIFITDSNREEKYFEIIEKAQTTEEPQPLDPETATFQDEQKYIEEKKAYEVAQDNLNTLETYLNAYDKLSKIKFVNDVLTTAKTNISDANSEDDITSAIDALQDKMNLFK